MKRRATRPVYSEAKLCKGCKWCRTRTLPDFSKMTEAEEVEFWSIHDTTIFEHQFEEVKGPILLTVPPPPRKLKVTMMIDPRLKHSLEVLARKKGIRYQTLAQMFLKEKVDQELKHIS